MTRGGERGFTLLEVLVALAILVFALTALYQALGGGLQANATAEREWRAAEAAETLLTEVGRSVPLRDGETKGELADGHQWILKITPFTPVDQDGPPSAVEGHLVTLDVSRADRNGPHLRLRTLLIGATQ
jgi:general secretion pathway protein I